MMITRNTTIDCAAIKDKNDIVHSLPRPARHNNIIHEMAKLRVRDIQDCEQGFLTNEGEFVNRYQASRIAYRSGQIAFRREFAPYITSEDLW